MILADVEETVAIVDIDEATSQPSIRVRDSWPDHLLLCECRLCRVSPGSHAASQRTC